MRRYEAIEAGLALIITVAVLPTGATAAATTQEPLMDCNELVVQYSEPQVVSLEEHISIQRLPQLPARLLNEYDQEFVPKSPQGTAAFNRVVVADTTKPGPRSNVIEVFSRKGLPVAWKLEAVDLRDNLRLQWLNEDLLFVQAWWGRIVSTDLIFELSTGRFIYSKEANYGLLIQPCEERKEPATVQ